MIEPTWRRIAGFRVEDGGDTGVVWLAHDTLTDTTHVYDAAIFRREVLAVIAEGISARGRWIPVSCSERNKDFSEKLLNAGINVLPDFATDKPSTAEVISREIWQRMRTNRFRVERRVGEWLEEYRNFYREDQKVPAEGFPLMAATRHAIEQLEFAKNEGVSRGRKVNYRRLATV